MVQSVVARTARAMALVLLSVPAARAEPAAPPDDDASSIEAPVENERAVPKTPPAKVIPPQALEAPGPPYPDGASGHAVVVIELSVDRDGAVSDVEVVSGKEPFSGVARRAAERYRFLPAKRGAEPIAAIIRMEVSFFEPEPEQPPSIGTGSAESPERPAPDAAKAPPAVTEVVVHGIRPEASKTTLSRAEVREIPGTFGDPFRAVEVMPGVTPIVSGLPYFFVRGAPPGNVGYYLDGIRVPLLYHFALGPSVIHPGLVDRVDLYAGGYPARYGRFAGGIVAAETTTPFHRAHGEANIRLFDAGAMLESPFLDGRATALAAGRYSYTAGILSLVAPEVTLSYWDYQLRGTVDLDEKNQLGLFGFGAYDLFTFEENGEENGASTQFHRVDLRWDHRASEKTRFRTAATLGRDRTGSEATSDVDIGVVDQLYAARFELEHRMSEAALFRAGADVTIDDVDASFTQETSPEDDQENEIEYFLPSRTDVATGVRGDIVLGIGAGVTVTPGLRVDAYRSKGATAVGVDPRVAARFDLGPSFSVEHALGIVHQPPSFIIPLPGFELADLRGGLQKAVQSSAGVEWPCAPSGRRH
jgi:hypothetical protein